MTPDQWRPWSERPTDGRMILAWFGDRAESVWSHEDGWRWFDGDTALDPPTHWIPHPEPPEEQET